MPFTDLFPVTIFYDKITTLSNWDNFSYVKYLTPLEYNTSEDSTILTTVNQRILNEKIFLDLKKIILDKTKEYLNELGHIYEDIQITNSWGVWNRQNSESAIHAHANSYISGVYYLTSGSDISFYKDPTTACLLPEIKPNIDNIRTLHTYNIPPYPGLLLLFPSDLKHKVNKSSESKDRYSIAFNIYPKGEFGRDTGKLFI